MTARRQRARSKRLPQPSTHAPRPPVADSPYLDVLTPEERDFLAGIADRSLADEIAIIRLQIRRILQQARDEDEDAGTPRSNPSATAHDLAKLTAALVRAIRAEAQRDDRNDELSRIIDEVASEILAEQTT